MMKVQDMPIGSVFPYEGNPRKIGDDAVDAVAASIREFGFQQPIVVDSQGVIIAGHTRYLAARKLGLDTVPVVVADTLTPEQVKAYRLADNRTGELAEWDDGLLGDELQELFDADIDMEQFGFDMGFLDDEEEPEAEEDDFDIDETRETDIREGDMFRLGEHILLCGDSSKSEAVRKLMGGEK